MFGQYLYGKQDVIVHSDHQPPSTHDASGSTVEVYSGEKEGQVHVLGRYVVKGHLDEALSPWPSRSVYVCHRWFSGSVQNRVRDLGTRHT